MKPIMNIPQNRKYALLIICILFMCKITSQGQTISDTSSFKLLFTSEVHTEDYTKYLENSESEMKMLVSFSFLFYKEYISSQDIGACVFHPSCSQYTVEAIEKKGVITGVLDGFDRLLRCHSFVDKSDYPYNALTQKYHDPLQ